MRGERCLWWRFSSSSDCELLTWGNNSELVGSSVMGSNNHDFGRVIGLEENLEESMDVVWLEELGQFIGKATLTTATVRDSSAF